MVSNLVLVQKKYGEIRLCVDFRDLNHASDKDNYPVPPMEQILQMVSGSKLFSLLYGFSVYNQVLVEEEDRLKTTFRTKWGIFAYRRMPFGLINAVKNVIADFTTHGESHFYGLPCPSTDSLDPMDHFCSFDVSKIIPKNMQKFTYMTFKLFLAYIRGFDP